MERLSADLSPIKNLEGVSSSFSQSLESSPGLFQDSNFDSLHAEYQSLKLKYAKLYKEHNLLLRSLELDKTDKQKDQEVASDLQQLILSLNSKIKSQEKELKYLHFTVDDLNIKLETQKPKAKSRRMTSYFMGPSSNSSLALDVSSLEISADISLLNFLIHRLLLGQCIGREDLLQYRSALQRIENRFEHLSSKLEIIY